MTKEEQETVNVINKIYIKYQEKFRDIFFKDLPINVFLTDLLMLLASRDPNIRAETLSTEGSKFPKNLRQSTQKALEIKKKLFDDHFLEDFKDGLKKKHNSTSNYYSSTTIFLTAKN